MRSYENITDAKLQFIDGLDNTSGVAEVGYFIPLSWMQTVAAPLADGTTAASLVEITTAHIMNVGKAPIEMQMLFDKSGVDGAMEGEVLSKIFKQGPARCFLPNINATALGTAGMIKNYRGIFLFKRIGGGDFFQIGSKEISAKVANGGVTFGTGPTGEVGVFVEFEAYSAMPMFVYQGELPVVGV